MERNYQITFRGSTHPDELHWRTAFHEAGHAAAIHILNRKKRLPPVFFEIQVKRPTEHDEGFFAKVVDGRLIQNLPIVFVESMSPWLHSAKHSCQQAYEADIVNLLVGPLAEAKYVALNDGEVFNQDLMCLEALLNYGGYSDLEMIQYYLEHFIATKSNRQHKLRELFVEAHRFISEPLHWRCIEQLANFILDSKQEVIQCDEAINIFDGCLAAQHKCLVA